MPNRPQTGARKIRVVLVDDEPLVRKGLALLLGGETDLVVCGAAENERQALEQIPALKPDLAVVDPGFKAIASFDLIKQLRQRCPKLKILVFSMHDRAHYVAGAFAAGAHGYVTKDHGTEELLEAIRWVMDGHFYLSEEMRAWMPSLLPQSALRHGRRLH